MFQAFSRRLYLRIWLAVVGGVAVLTLLVGWAWRVAEEHKARELAQQQGATARELAITDEHGNLLLQGPFERKRRRGGESVFLIIHGADGKTYHIEMSSPPRPNPSAAGGGGGAPGGHARANAPHGTPPPNAGRPSAWAFWLQPPFGFLWTLALVGVAVAVGVFPIIRRLLKRLENLQRGVQRFGEGDLSVRVPTEGRDEVADLARQFNAAAARIEDLVQSHKTLLANASHELRSPLTRIRMGLELLGVPQDHHLAPQDVARLHTAREEIRRNIAELDQLIDEILLASRLESREADVGTTEPVDLIGLAAEECARVDAELDVQPLAAADGQLHSLEVPAIAKLVRRAVRNLLENARRYSHGGITLTLECESCDDHSTSSAPHAGYPIPAPARRMAVVRVQDHGPGVPPEQRERIFEKFYRLPGASERSGGVGLGLSLVRSIAQRHGGTVHCQDRNDGAPGACFVLRLPLDG